jgi:hypothetical protein
VRLHEALALLLVIVMQPAQAQEFDSNAVHWAYASYFGTGWYRIGDNGDAFVIRATPRWEFREPSFDDHERKIGIEFRLPVTVGLDTFTFDDPTGSIDPSNLATLSITPGVDITVPVNSRWSLKPYASIGWGTVLSESESAWTYWAGIKSRYRFGNGKLDWALLNALGYVGYSPSNGYAEDFWPLMIGLELDHDLGQMKLGGEQAVLTWHGMYTTFENDLDAVLETGAVAPITDQWELGLALRRKETNIKIWFFRFDRLGLAYRFSSNGQFKGVAVIFRSVFER